MTTPPIFIIFLLTTFFSAVSAVGNAEATLTLTPSGPELHANSFVTFTCEITGNPRPTKLNFKKGDTVLKSYNAAGGTDNDIIVTTYNISYTHDISSLALDDTGNYTCEGENDNGGPQTDEETKNLIVMSDVVVKMTSSTTAPIFGTAFTITCTATGGRKPHSVELQHIHAGKAIPVSNLTCSSENEYSEKCTYTSTANYTCGGIYFCTGKNIVARGAETQYTETITILVSKAVSVSLIPASASGQTVEITPGSTNTFTCNVNGGDKPHKVNFTVPDSTDNLIWQRDGQVNSLFTCTGEFEISCEYRLSNVTYSHEGDYTCTGYNKLPGSSAVETDFKTVSLVVVRNVTVYLSIDPATTEINHGTEIKITCVADGGRMPFFLEIRHTSASSNVTKLVTYDTTTSKTPVTVTVDETANTLTYVHTVAVADYEDNGSYSCQSKNRASSNAEKNDEKSKEVIVVKNVEIETIHEIEADFGTSFSFTFKLNGGRSPHSVILANTRSTIFDWSENSNECTGTNELTCSKTVEDFDVNFEYDGDYTVTAKNRAKNNAVITATESFRVTVYKYVSATIEPSSDGIMTYHVDKTITCNVIGGFPPHKVDLILPNQVTKTWTQNGTGNSLTCTGTYNKTCTYTFTPEYNSDGNYKCVGYNKVRSAEEWQKESTVVQLTTVRSTEVTISNETLQVLTNGTVDILCAIVGKPLVDISAVSWSHETLPDLDLSGNVSTVKGSQDDYTLVSTLSIVNPLTEYSGIYNCNVQAEEDQVIIKSVLVSISNREYLDVPIVDHNGGEAVEQDTEISIICLVKGFPRPSATLIYKNLDYSDLHREQSRTISGAFRFDYVSPTSTEFEFRLSTSCDYSQYKFICETQNTKYSDGRLLKESSSAEGPIVTGCENILPVMIGGGVGGTVAFITMAVIVAFCIIKRVKRNRKKEYSPKNGTQILNVVYVNTTPENLGETEQSIDQSYENLGGIQQCTDQNYENLGGLEQSIDQNYENLGGFQQSTEHKHDGVVLHVATGKTTYVNTTVQSPSTPALHLYNDVILPTNVTDDIDDSPYAYARSEDVVRNNVKPPVYHNHELK